MEAVLFTVSQGEHVVGATTLVKISRPFSAPRVRHMIRVITNRLGIALPDG
jgi:hypothetical protein